MSIMGFLKNKLFRASATLAVLSFLADLAALLRDRILAAHFGAGRSLDIYYSAFKIPDLIFNLLILGALSSAFIPVFIEHYWTDSQRAWRLTQNFLSFALAAILSAAAIIFILARPLSFLVAPGFNAADRDILVQLMRLMLLSPVLFSISAIVGSVLQSLERFAAYAIAPVLYNLGIIAGAVYFVPFVQAAGRPAVLGLGLGVIFGAVLHLAVQMPSAVLAGFKFKLVFDAADRGFKKIIRLMIPRTVGLGAYSIDTAVTNAIASTLGAGSIATFNFANNLQFVPIAVVGVSVATAVFPRLSMHAGADEHREFLLKLRQALRATAAIVLSAAAVIFIFREVIIRIIFGVGAFSQSSVHLTASILGIFMFGIAAQSLVPIMSRAFYALQDTRTPVTISILSILINIGLGLLFTFGWHWDIYGLALAFVISGNFNFFMLHIVFHKRYPAKHVLIDR